MRRPTASHGKLVLLHLAPLSCVLLVPRPLVLHHLPQHSTALRSSSGRGESSCRPSAAAASRPAHAAQRPAIGGRGLCAVLVPPPLCPKHCCGWWCAIAMAPHHGRDVIVVAVALGGLPPHTSHITPHTTRAQRKVSAAAESPLSRCTPPCGDRCPREAVQGRGQTSSTRAVAAAVHTCGAVGEGLITTKETKAMANPSNLPACHLFGWAKQP